METLISFLVGQAVKQGKQYVKTKGLLTSATTQAATVGTAVGMAAADWPLVFQGDPMQIGIVVLLVLTWARAVWGRWRAGNMGKAKK